jgi:dipeptidyl aminopeptidase/acylaminoacyl peptidase
MNTIIRTIGLSTILAIVVVASDDFEKRAVTIWSDGVRMAGDLYLPKSTKPNEKLPAVLFCAGTGGTKKGTPQQLAPRFVHAGFVFLAFDYRGWGESDSRLMSLDKQPVPDAKNELSIRVRAIRWQMDFADQAMDIRAAISFLAGEPNVDPRSIGIMGTSYGGGLVTWTAGNDPRVRCVATQVGGMGGGRGPAADQYAYNLATKQARAETEPVPFETGKMTGKMAAYAQMRVNTAKSIGYNPIEAAAKIRVPMIIIDAENDELIDHRQNGERVAEILKSNGVPVGYHVIKGITHYGVYRQGFEEATQLELEWFTTHLKKGQP